jgi:hypothetical protein
MGRVFAAGAGSFPAIVISTLFAASPAAAQASQQEIDRLRNEVQELRSLVTALKARLDTVEQKEAAAPPPAPAMPAQAAVTPQPSPAPPAQLAVASVQQRPDAAPLPPRETIGDKITGASRPGNAAPPNDPDLKGFISIPGTETMVRIGGYAKVDAILDPAFVGNRDEFAVPSTSFGRTARNRATINARGTRFNLEIRRPSTLGNLRFYVENDFYGDGTGYNFHLNHAYGQVGNTYGGFGYSALVDADALPDTLDDWGPGGAIFLRTASVRHAFKLAANTHLTLSLERPESDLALSGDQTGADTMPDVVLVGRYESDGGHLQLGGVIRRIGYRDEAGRSGEATGFGLSASGSLALFGDDGLSAGINYGRGAARYSNDLNGMGLDAVILPGGRLRLIEHVGGYAAYTHHWNTAFRSSLVLSAVRVNDEPLLDPTALRETRYGALNLIWSPVASFSVGLEGLYGRVERQDGLTRDSSRIQATVKYDFVR